MTSEVSTKKRRIMIITADESIIEQLQSNNNASLFKSIILDSNGENVELRQSLIEQQPTNQTTTTTTTTTATTNTTKKVKNDSLTCVVCGSPAHGYNFDAISCESCKAFFRRNALKDPASLECRRSSDCDITIDSRRRCSACRLSKCLSSGMKRDRLLTAEEKALKRRKIEENRNLTREISVDAPKSTEQTDSSILPIKATNLLLLSDYKDLLPENSRTLLSSDELKRVETIQLSFEQRIQLAARDGLPWNPSWYANTLLQQLNARSVTALRLLSFFKQIPEFNELNTEDKLTLVKYNLMPLVILNCSLAYDSKKGSVIEDKSDAPIDYSILLKKHNEELYNRVKKIFESFVRIAQHDQRTIQLALVILILTKGSSTNGDANEPILNDAMSVYRAQSYYTELLWKYLETVHSHDKAIQLFNELVAHFISWQSLQISLRDICTALTPSEMNELLPIMKSLLNIS